MDIFNNRGCFGGGKTSTPAVQAPPPPAPPPPTPSEPMATQANVQKQMEKFRYGLASTIKTSARGLTGQGSDLMGKTQLKNKLGA